MLIILVLVKNDWFQKFMILIQFQEDKKIT